MWSFSMILQDYSNEKGHDMEDLKRTAEEMCGTGRTVSVSSFSREDAWRLGEMLVDAAGKDMTAASVGIGLQNGLKVF